MTTRQRRASVQRIREDAASYVVKFTTTAVDQPVYEDFSNAEMFEVLDGGGSPNKTYILMDSSQGGGRGVPDGLQSYRALPGVKGLGPFKRLTVVSSELVTVTLRIYKTRSIAVTDGPPAGTIQRQLLARWNAISFAAGAGTQILNGNTALTQGERQGLDAMSERNDPQLSGPYNDCRRYWEGMFTANAEFAIHVYWSPVDSANASSYELVQMFHSYTLDAASDAGFGGLATGYTGGTGRHIVDMSRNVSGTKVTREAATSAGTSAVFSHNAFQLVPIPPGSIKLGVEWKEDTQTLSLRGCLYAVSG